MTAADDYRRRLSRYANTALQMLRPSDAADEAKSLLAAAASSRFVVTLEERGRSFSTDQLVAWYREHGHYQSFCYLLGHADGLAQALHGQCDDSWSLSPLTLPHRGALAVLLEQLYRVHTVLAGEAYHRSDRPMRAHAQQTGSTRAARARMRR